MRRSTLARLIAAGLAGSTVTMAGCASTPFGIDPEQDRKPIVQAHSQAEQNIREIHEARNTQYRRHETPYAGTGIVESNEDLAEQADWLQKKITLSTSDVVGVNASEVARMFRKSGVAITSSLPLSSYSYNGYGVKDVTTLTALRVIFGSMGLDYRIDHTNQVVEIQPMGWKTWYVNLGNRVTSFSSGSANNSGSSGRSGQSGRSGGTSGGISSGGIGQTSGSMGSSMGGFGSSGSTGTTSGQNNENGGIIYVTDDFWSSLEQEMEDRLTMLIPSDGLGHQNERIRQQIQNILPSSLTSEDGETMLPMPSSGPPGTLSSGRNDMYKEVELGRFALNRETGAISVQAPRWVQEGVAEYIKDIQNQYNTSLEFKGKLFLVSSDQQNQAGIDLSGFADFADNYGLYVQNNALGGVTVRKPTAASLLQATAQEAIGSSMIGVKAADNTLQVFNAFLEQQGDVAVIQEPSLSTTSGVPATFSKFNPLYYNTVTQDAAVSEGGGAVVGTQNEIVRVDLGTRMSINPRFDPKQRLVRAQIDLQQILQSGTQTINQTVSSSTGVTQNIPVEIPITEELSFSGETLLRDGDLIIMGGQRTSQTELNGSGTTGLRDVPAMGNLFGKRSRSKTADTYYFALQVEVIKK